MTIFQDLFSLIKQPAPTKATEAVYQALLKAIQKRLLIVQLLLNSFFSIIFLSLTFVDVLLNNNIPPWLTITYMFYLIAIPVLGYLFIRLDRVITAWILVIVVSFLTTLVIIQIDLNAFLLVYMLFSMSWAAIVLNWRTTLLLMILVIASLYLSTYIYLYAKPKNLDTSIFSFMILMSGFIVIGVVIQGFLRQHAQVSFERQLESEQVLQRERELDLMRQRLRQITMLKHDLLQPLRVVQGHLMELEINSEDQHEVIIPAMAAAYRAERLMSNLLDQARNEANQQRIVHRHTNLNDVFERIHQALPGLVQYYEPRLKIEWRVSPLPVIRLDPEQFERAIMNLLDNALNYASTSVTIRAYVKDKHVVIEIQDDGPGMPIQLMQKIMSKDSYHPEKGFGLYQVRSVVSMMGGKIHFVPNTQGTLVQLSVPFDITDMLAQNY